MAQPQNSYGSAVERLLRLIRSAPQNAAATPPDPQRLRHFSAFMDTLGTPHAKGRFIHIAGSKGKGSTARMLDAVLREAGHSTLLFTSPALHAMNERIRVNGSPADPQQFAQDARRVLEARSEFGAEHVNFFDVLTAIALMSHACHQPDFTVLETGMGGRLDSTNIVTPDLAVITRIELEHTEVLGDTIALIAREKAGIIKPGVPVVSAPQQPDARAVIAARAAELQAPLLETPPNAVRRISAQPGAQQARFTHGGAEHRFTLPLMGSHQLRNAAVAIAAAARLGIAPASIAEGLRNTRADGCAQLVPGTPPLIADGCHTPLSARALAEALGDHLNLREGAAVVFGTTRGHDTPATLRELAPLGTRFIPVGSRHPKSVPADEVADLMRRAGIEPQPPAPSAAAALDQLRGADFPAVVACGSIAVAAEALQAAQAIPSDF